jgi:hypothetical protein
MMVDPKYDGACHGSAGFRPALGMDRFSKQLKLGLRWAPNSRQKK